MVFDCRQNLLLTTRKNVQIFTSINKLSKNTFEVHLCFDCFVIFVYRTCQLINKPNFNCQWNIKEINLNYFSCCGNRKDIYHCSSINWPSKTRSSKININIKNCLWGYEWEKRERERERKKENTIGPLLYFASNFSMINLLLIYLLFISIELH